MCSRIILDFLYIWFQHFQLWLSCLKMTYTHREEGVTLPLFQWLDFKFSLARVVCEKFTIFVVVFFFFKKLQGHKIA